MSYKIVVDSSCDLSKDMKSWNNLEVVPLTLQLGDYIIKDDENFDQDDFVERVKAYDGYAKSACPSPEAFANACEGDYDEVYIITITDKLSGSYNSALQGKAIYEEDHEDGKKIHVFNSLATSAMLTFIANEIKKYGDEGKPFDEIVERVEDFIVNHAALYWCLESIDALKANGRLFALAAKVIEKIRVKLICRAVDGNLSLVSQDITINRAMMKMTNIVIDKLKDVDMSDETVYVTYVRNEERARMIANKLSEKLNIGNLEIIKCSGLNTLYATDGAIFIGYTNHK